MASDAQELKRHFEKLSSARLSERREGPVSVHVGKKSLMYKYTIRRFKQLLGSVDNDLELAKQIITVLFEAPEFRWKSRTSVTDLLADWDAGTAIVKALLEDKRDAEERRKPFDAATEELWEKLYGSH